MTLADTYVPAGTAIMVMLVVAVFLIVVGLALRFIGGAAVRSYRSWCAGRQNEGSLL